MSNESRSMTISLGEYSDFGAEQLYIIEIGGQSTGDLTYGEMLHAVAAAFNPNDWPGWLAVNIKDPRLVKRSHNPYASPIE